MTRNGRTTTLTRMRADTFRARLRLGLPFEGPVHVPEGLKIRDTGIERLCDALCVDGHLDLGGCTNLRELPANLIVRGRLTITGCRAITDLPTTVREIFGLSAVGCEALRSIGGIVECHGSVDLSGCRSLAPLPPKFRAKRMMTLDECVIVNSWVKIMTTVPETILASLPGRQFGEVLQPKAITGHPVLKSVVESARSGEGETVLYLQADALVEREPDD